MYQLIGDLIQVENFWHCMGLAVCRNMDLVDNFLLTTRQGYASSVWLKRAEARTAARSLITQFHVSPPDESCRAWQLIQYGVNFRLVSGS